jgi:acyl carrier protein
MTPADIRAEVLDILENIAPDEDLSNLQDEVSFREQLEWTAWISWTSSWSCASGTASRFPRRITQLASMSSTVKYLTPLMKDL